MEKKHVTHVTGIACGNGYSSNGKYAGVAPKSNIISIKILDALGQGNSTQALAGIQWIIDNKEKYNIRIANLSIGTNDHSLNFPLIRAVNAAWDKGIVIIAASGNSDSKSGAVSAPGMSKKIITVGSYSNIPSQQNYNRLPFFADYSHWADVYAPGVDIISCLSPTYSFRSKNKDELKIVEENYIKMTGTSMSTPMVSGAVALLLEKYPNLTPYQIKNMLYVSSTKYQRNNSGGLLNIGKLV